MASVPTREARGRVPHVSKPTECRASAAGALRRAALREAVLRNEWRPRTAPGGAGGLARPGSSPPVEAGGAGRLGQHYGAARRPTTSNRDQGRGPAVPGPGGDPETRSRVPRRTNSKRYANFGSKKRADPSGGEETRLGNWKSVPCSVQFGVQFSSGSVRVQFSSGSPSGESMKRPTSPGLGAWPSISSPRP